MMLWSQVEERGGKTFIDWTVREEKLSQKIRSSVDPLVVVGSKTSCWRPTSSQKFKNSFPPRVVEVWFFQSMNGRLKSPIMNNFACRDWCFEMHEHNDLTASVFWERSGGKYMHKNLVAWFEFAYWISMHKYSNNASSLLRTSVTVASSDDI